MAQYDLIIVGAGPAGMTAAIYGARADLSVLMLDRLAPGGNIINTNEIQNYPGVGFINGAELAIQMFEQTQQLGITFDYRTVVDIREENGEKAVVCLEDDMVYTGRTVIIATGTQSNKLHCEGEENFTGNGISWCAICDGAAYRDKDVVVIGGGFAGLEAAMTAAQRGHRVTLLEQSDALGGVMAHTEDIWFKYDTGRFRDYLVCQCRKAGVKIRLNTRATRAMLDDMDPDAVIVAVGAEPVIPNIPGVRQDHVWTAIHAYGHEDQLGGRVVLVGGGMVGCETALHLSRLGKQVTLVEMLDVLAPDGIYTERLHTVSYIGQDPSITVMTDTRCVEITPEGAVVAGADGQRQLLPADSVVLSAGMKSLTAERDQFSGLAYDVIPIGDCQKVGTISSATMTAYNAALTIGLDG